MRFLSSTMCNRAVSRTVALAVALTLGAVWFGAATATAASVSTTKPAQFKPSLKDAGVTYGRILFDDQTVTKSQKLDKARPATSQYGFAYACKTSASVRVAAAVLRAPAGRQNIVMTTTTFDAKSPIKEGLAVNTNSMYLLDRAIPAGAKTFRIAYTAVTTAGAEVAQPVLSNSVYVSLSSIPTCATVVAPAGQPAQVAQPATNPAPAPVSSAPAAKPTAAQYKYKTVYTSNEGNAVRGTIGACTIGNRTHVKFTALSGKPQFAVWYYNSNANPKAKKLTVRTQSAGTSTYAHYPSNTGTTALGYDIEKDKPGIQVGLNLPACY